MKELMVIATVAIVFGVIYKLFELFVRRKERMMLIEKLPPEMLDKEKTKFPKFFSFSESFLVLRAGCLLLGIGIGLISSYCIVYNTQSTYFTDYTFQIHETVTLIYAASILIGGGLGLIVAFLVELKLNKKKEEEHN